MDYLVALNQIFLMFLLVIVGFICRKLNILTDKSLPSLSKFLLNVCIPAMIISSMQISFSDAIATNAGTVVIGALVFYVIGFVIAWFLPYLLRAKKEEFGVFRYMSIFANTMFMGFPVLSMMFGQEAIFYAAIFNIPFSILAFSVGIWILKKKTGEKVHVSPKILLNAGFLSTIVGLIFFFTSFTIPQPFAGAIDLLGNATTPLSLVITGGFLANFKIPRIFTNVRVYIASLVRLLLIPVVTWFVCSFFVTDPLILGIIVISSAMPAAVNTVILAQEHDANPSLAAQVVFISTLLALGTLPIFMIVFG